MAQDSPDIVFSFGGIPPRITVWVLAQLKKNRGKFMMIVNEREGMVEAFKDGEELAVDRPERRPL